MCETKVFLRFVYMRGVVLKRGLVEQWRLGNALKDWMNGLKL